MHRKMEYIDLFSSTRVLYKLPSYREGDGFASQFPERGSHNVHSTLRKKAKSTQQSGVHHAVVLGSDKSIQKKGTIPSSTVTQREKLKGKLTG